jgi:hypothetical protein
MSFRPRVNSEEDLIAPYGALVENGLTKGLFVSTSDFQPGAVKSARTFTQLHGRPIELIDAEKFYDALKIAQRRALW